MLIESSRVYTPTHIGSATLAQEDEDVQPLGLVALGFDGGKATFIYAVGSLKTGSFQPVIQSISVPTAP